MEKYSVRGDLLKSQHDAEKSAFAQNIYKAGEQPGEEARELSSVCIVDWRVVRLTRGPIAMVDE